jgi:hypothetical protein
VRELQPRSFRGDDEPASASLVNHSNEPMHQGIAGSRHFVWAGQWSINRLLRSTIRQRSADIARGYDWPAEFTGRVLRTAFVSRWDGREAEHRAVAEAERPHYLAAVAEGRTEDHSP